MKSVFLNSTLSISIICSVILTAVSCAPTSKEKVDLLVYNAKIYTVDSSFSVAEAMAVKDGKIVAAGSTDQLNRQYEAEASVDAEGNTVIPGLFDAHFHFYNVGKSMMEVDLTNTQSPEEMIQRIVDFQQEKKQDYIAGRGWDQNLWPTQEFPDKKELDKLFPDIPVLLKRVDGHALLVNQKVLDMAGIDENAEVEGGTYIKKKGKLTGVLIDNAMDKVYSVLPHSDEADITQAFLNAQEECFSYGLTSIADAGASHRQIQMMDKLKGENQLKIGLYPMLIYADSHLDDYLFNHLGENKYVSSRSVKFLSDGALGSRGAALKAPYSDDPDNYGKLLASPDYITELVEKVARSDFQLNTHAIGDSANHFILEAYHKFVPKDTDRRWRIEHAQIIDTEDLSYFDGHIIPSIQPTHAISDMFWAKDRLGEERLSHAYIYKTLLDKSGIVALGTDAPVEEVDPYRTFYAAVARKNRKGEPKDGFQTENALSREEALRGMTIWAAYAQFEENSKGSLEPGKQADFVIIDKDIMQVPIDEVLQTKVKSTYVKGEKVYTSDK